MKARTVVLFLFLCTFSITAQNNNYTPPLNGWAVGLNFGMYTFNGNNNFNSMSITLEKRFNEHFSLSIGTGLELYRQSNSGSFSFFNDNSSGNTVAYSVNNEFEPSVNIPLNISLKYNPFDWKLSPYVAIGYGVNYCLEKNNVTTTNIDIYSSNGNLLSQTTNRGSQKVKGSFFNHIIYGAGVTYNIYSNLHLDANVSYNGYYAPTISFGIKYGF